VNASNLDDLNAEKSYSAFPVHLNTVIGNEALVNEIDVKGGNKINVYGLNPGLIYTEIRSNYFGKNTYLSSIVETIISVRKITLIYIYFLIVGL
jgi:hypothetical protein